MIYLVGIMTAIPLAFLVPALRAELAGRFYQGWFGDSWIRQLEDVGSGEPEHRYALADIAFLESSHFADIEINQALEIDDLGISSTADYPKSAKVFLESLRAILADELRAQERLRRIQRD